MYIPALFWRFLAGPLLQSDLGFIMEELDRCYNRAVTLAKRLATAGLLTPDSDPTDCYFNYPLVEKFLMTKRCSRTLLQYYLLCRSLTLVTLLCACLYLGYYLRLASVTDDFACKLRVKLLESEPGVPDKVQCKLIAVGVFFLLSLVNLILFVGLIPVVIYAALRPLLCHGYARFLETYQSLPTVSVLPTPEGQWDDLSLYLLFLEENISELKSYKYIKVLELLRRQGECVGEDFDAMGLLQTLCLVKLDTLDGTKAAAAAAAAAAGVKTEEVKLPAADPSVDLEAANSRCRTKSSVENNSKVEMEMEMKELAPLLMENCDVAGNNQSAVLRQRAM